MIDIYTKVILWFGIVNTLTTTVHYVMGEILAAEPEDYYPDYKMVESNAPQTNLQGTKYNTTGSIHNKVTKDELLKYLTDISGFQTISGVFLEYKSIGGSQKEVENVHRITEVFPGVLTQMMSIPSAGPNEWQPFINEAISNWNNGYLVHIVWLQWDNHMLSMYDYQLTDNEKYNEMKWKDLTENGGTLNNEWKKLLDSIAPYLLQLQNAGVVAICDLLPYINFEHNWRGRPGRNGSQKLYQMSHDYLKKQHEIKSIIWTWSLYIYGTDGELNEISQYWPGANYVDVVSVYTPAAQLTLEEYEKLLDVVGDKPISLEDVSSPPTSQLLSTQPR